jgi:hypothetical protein
VPSPLATESSGLDNQSVSIRYKERKSRWQRTSRLSGDESMRRFLQHVLPRCFHKVRYFDLWHPAQRHNAARVRQMLQLQAPPKIVPLLEPGLTSVEQPGAEPMQPLEPRICPRCHQGRLVFIRTVPQDTPRQAMAP